MGMDLTSHSSNSTSNILLILEYQLSFCTHVSEGRAGMFQSNSENHECSVVKDHLHRSGSTPTFDIHCHYYPHPEGDSKIVFLCAIQDTQDFQRPRKNLKPGKWTYVHQIYTEIRNSECAVIPWMSKNTLSIENLVTLQPIFCHCFPFINSHVPN